jgi:epidermal growth factor receptor substrate 15
MNKFLFSITSFFFLLISVYSFAQDTEESLRAKAEKLYKAEDYVQATKVYTQLLAIQPRDYFYNFRYGTCLLYNSQKKSAAIKHLDYASKAETIDPEVFYYLGKAYHLNYQFNDAIKNFNIYKSKAGVKAVAALDVDRQIEMCQNGKRLLSTLTDMIVIEKKEIELDKFFRIYDLRNIGGDMIVTAEFQTKIDKKKGHTPLIHFPANPNIIFYSSYGEEEKTGKDIYVRRKLPDGTWSLPQPVRGDVNTRFDEDFPYMHPGGEYLYFSSKGHNSMGGFDVFRSRYNEDENTYGPPENLDFAISSPDNDLFYVVDSLDRNAYFASSRQSKDGKIHVYKVRVERFPTQLAVVKGSFVSSINPNNKNVSIEVFDHATDLKIGTFNSNEKASYLVTFPKGGKYNYVVKIDGNPNEYKFLIDIPFLKAFKPLKQKITEDMVESSQVVKVLNLFDEDVEDPVSVMAEIAQIRSELKPNVDQYNLEELDKKKASKEIFAELGMAKFSEIEVKNTIQKIADNQEKEANELEALLQKSLDKISQNAKEINNLQNDVKSIVASTNSMTDEQEKYNTFHQSEIQIEKADILESNTKKLLSLTDSISSILNKEKNEASLMRSLSTNLNTAISEGNKDEIVKILSEKKNEIQALQRADTRSIIEKVIDKKVEKKTELDKIEEKKAEYVSASSKIDKEIKQLNDNLATAKPKDKPAIESSIDSKMKEQSMYKEEEKIVTKKIEALRNQLIEVDKELALLQEVNKQSPPENKLYFDEVKSLVQNTENQNYKTVKAFVSQQKTELSKNPNLVVSNSEKKAGNFTLPEFTVNSKRQITKIKPQHEEKLQTIISDNTLSDVEKIEQLKFENEVLKSKIDNELREKEAISKADPRNEPLKVEIKTLHETKSVVEKYIEEQKNQLASLSDSKPVLASSTSTIEKVKPDHKEKIEKIEKNQSLSPKEKLQQIQNEDKNLMAKIDQEIRAKEKLVTANPSNNLAKKELEELKALKISTGKMVRERENEIASASDEIPVLANKEVVLEKIKPNHEEKLQAIQNNASLTPTQKIEQAQNEDKILKSKVEAEIKQKENALTSNPNDANAKSELAALNEIKSTVENRIQNRETNVASTSSQSPSVNKEVVLEKIKPNHEEKLQAIQNNASLTPTQKIEQAQNEDKILKSKVEAEIKQKENALTSNPNDANAKSELAALNEIKSTVENRIQNRETNVASTSSQSPSVNKEVVLEKIKPNHEEKLQAIQNNASLTPTQKIEQAQNEDKILKSKVEAEIKQKENALTSNPNDANAKSELAALNEIKSTVENRIQNRETNVASTSSQSPSVNKEVVLEKIKPNHEEKLQAIQNNASLTPTQKIEQAQNEDKILKSKVEAEIKQKENALTSNPNDANAKSELAALNEIKSTVENRIQNRESNLASISINSNEETISSAIEDLSVEAKNSLAIIKPGHETKLKEIENNKNLSRKLKLEQSQFQDRQLRNEVEKKIKQVQENILVNPNENSQNELIVLNELKSNVNSRIKEREIQINMATKADEEIVSTDFVLEKAISNHDAKLASIEGNSSLTKVQKIEFIQKEDKELKTKIDAELKKSENIKFFKPEDESIDRQIASLKEFKSTLDTRIDNRIAKIAQAIEEENSVYNVNYDVVDKVKPKHESKIAEIVANPKLSETDKQQKLIKEEIVLQKNLVSNLNIIEKSLTKDPDNVDLKNEKADLEKINKLSETRIQESKKAIVENEKSKINTDELIKKIDKSYDTEIAVLEISNPSQKDAIIAREEVLQKNLSTQLEKNNQAIAKKEDLKLVAQNEILKDAIENSKEKVKNLTTKETDALASETKLTKDNESLVNEAESLTNNKNTTVTDKTDVKNVSSEISSDIVLEKIKPNHEEKLQAIQNNASLTPTQKIEQAQNEDKILKSKVDAEIKQKETLLASNPNDANTKNELVALNEIKTNVDVRIQSRENKANIENTQTEIVSNQKPINLKKELLGADADKLNTNPTTLDEVEILTKLLNSYETELLTKKVQTEKSISENPTNASSKELLNTIQTELVETKKLKIKLNEARENLQSDDEDDYKKSILAGNKAYESLKNDEANLLEQLKAENTDAKKTEKIEKQLAVIKEKQLKLENTVILAHINNAKKEQIALNESLKQNITVDAQALENELLSIRLFEERQQKIERDLKIASAEKSQESKNELLTKLLSENKKLEEDIIELKVDQKMASSYKDLKNLEKNSTIYMLTSKKDLQYKVGSATIEIDELKREIEKNPSNVSELQNALKTRQNNLNLMEKELAKRVDINPTLSKNELNEVEISEKEIEAILKSESYAQIFKSYKEVEKWENFVISNNLKIEKLKEELRLLVIDNALNPDPLKNLAITNGIEEIASAIRANKTRQEKYEKNLAEFEKLLSENDANSSKIKLLLSKNIESYSEQIAATTATKNSSTKSETKETENLASTTVDKKEQTTKSTQNNVVNNNESSLTSKESKENDKKIESIKKDSDLTIVDKNLKSSEKDNALNSTTTKTNTKVAENVVSTQKTTATKSNSTSSITNATPIGNKQGLFFTVQIGFYSKPVSTKALKNISPLMTYTLENGNIRYFTGVFSSVNEAKRMQEDIHKKGIKDAFVTAYYKGERITIAEAEKLLEETGSNILEKE